MNGPKVDAIVIGKNGYPVKMRAAHPVAFAIYKTWMSLQENRDPTKRLRDRSQAENVTSAVRMSGYLPDTPLAEVTYMPAEAKRAAAWLPEAVDRAMETAAVDEGL